LTVFLLLFVNFPCENYPESSDFIHKLVNNCQFSLLFSFWEHTQKHTLHTGF